MNALAVGLEPEDVEAVADAVGSVEPVDPDRLGERLSETAPACVVLGALGGGDTAAAAERAAAADAPVVVRAPADHPDMERIVAIPSARVVPSALGPGALESAVGAAIEERERREEEGAMLSAILRRSPIEIAVKDTECRHRRSTKTVRHDDVTGRTDAEYFGGDRAEQLVELERRALAEGEPVRERRRYEIEASGVDDHDAGWIDVWAFPWVEGGRDRGLISFAQDVTGVAETERRLTEKNELLEQFASVVSHDLRNPLNVAEGRLELGRERGDPEHFDAVERAHDRMNEIIDDLLGLARESDRTLSVSSVDLGAVARAAWSTVDTGAATLSVETDGTVIRADEALLRRALENLFRNAVEHGGDGVTVTVGVEADGFHVADDGPGLPPGVRERLNAGEFNSGGLGLNIVRTIADRHGWGLEARGDDGAVFAFTGCRLISKPGVATVDGRSVELTGERSVGEFAGGSARLADGTWTVEGRGRNLWRDVAEFHFAHGTVEGDADLVARVTGLDAPHGSAKAGVMVRAGADPGTPHGFVGCVADGGSELLWQLEGDAGTQARRLEDGPAQPAWYRLKRAGETVTLFVSADGTEWVPVDEQRLPLGDRALYGLAVTSHDGDAPATATFEDVALAAVTWD